MYVVRNCVLALCLSALGGFHPRPLVMAQTPGSEIEFKIVHTGTNSGLKEKKTYIITTKADWEKFWGQVFSPQTPVPPLPEIDFTKRIVLAVSQGEQRSGGYKTRITKLTKSAAGIEVTVKDVSPGKDCATTDALTDPYSIVEIEKTDLPVSFRRVEKVKDCK